MTQNVYDSPTGRILLIPQGARLIGDYDSEIAKGQNRVLLARDRPILPGVQSIALDRLPGADASGMAGLSDRTDYHWGHMLKAVLVSTLLSVGAERGASDEDRFAKAVRGGAQDSFNETRRQVVERQLRISLTPIRETDLPCGETGAGRLRVDDRPGKPKNRIEKEMAQNVCGKRKLTALCSHKF